MSHAIRPATASGDTGDTSSGDSFANTPFTPISTHGKSDVNSVVATPGHHDLVSEGNTVNAGQKHRRDIRGKPGAYDIAPQTKTFTQLARERGVREWNSTAFDDRWLLQPDELAKSHDLYEPAFPSIYDTESDDPFSDSPSKMGKVGGPSTYWGPTSHGPKSSMAKNGSPGSGQQHRGTQSRDLDQLNGSFNSSTTRISSHREESE